MNINVNVLNTPYFKKIIFVVKIKKKTMKYLY